MVHSERRGMMLKKDGICFSTSCSSYETSHPFERIRTVTVTVCVSANSMFSCSMKPSAWGLFGVSGGFWFFEISFPRFFRPRFGESLGTFWAKRSFRENPTSNGFVFFVYCLPQEKGTRLFLVIKFQKI